MGIDEKIKEGLRFSIKTTSIGRDNISFLKRGMNEITLTCQYSGMDCNMVPSGHSVSYDIEFNFHIDYLQSFVAEDDLDIHPFPDSVEHEICCNTQMILHEIVNCRFSGAFRNMFLESKALALFLCFQKCAIGNQFDCGTCKFLTKPYEREKIIRAKEIILDSLNDPPTIAVLSLQTGINQCYLKKGFKEIFGMTVYDFIQEQRMLKAKLLLKQNTYSVSQVAEEIGFSSTSNFSNAFKKYAGVFPSELLTN